MWSLQKGDGAYIKPSPFYHLLPYLVTFKTVNSSYIQSKIHPAPAIPSPACNRSPVGIYKICPEGSACIHPDIGKPKKAPSDCPWRNGLNTYLRLSRRQRRRRSTWRSEGSSHATKKRWNSLRGAKPCRAF